MSKSNQSIKTISNALELGSETRNHFLNCTVVLAQRFLDKNNKLFAEWLDCASEEEKREGQPGGTTKEGSDKARNDRIARNLAQCAKGEICKLFDLIYGADSFCQGEVLGSFG